MYKTGGGPYSATRVDAVGEKFLEMNQANIIDLNNPYDCDVPGPSSIGKDEGREKHVCNFIKVVYYTLSRKGSQCFRPHRLKRPVICEPPRSTYYRSLQLMRPKTLTTFSGQSIIVIFMTVVKQYKILVVERL